MNTPVFISYSTDDTPIAEAIRDGLEVSGVPCWMASATSHPVRLLNFKEYRQLPRVQMWANCDYFVNVPAMNPLGAGSV